MKAILVANPKGGSGKTTLSTNLAGMLAMAGEEVRLLDLDRQQSASHWLARRPDSLPVIHRMEGGPVEGKGWLVIDSPAALHGKNLIHALKLVHKVLIPIGASLFDIQASQDFLRVLADEKMVRKGKIDIAVVGMRMAPRTRAAVTLEEYLHGLDLPVLAYLREAQNYVNAAFEGKTIFDLPPHLAERDQEDWLEISRWLWLKW
ncbi:MAG: ParA family protein [Thiobacillaceae bacterium]|jgi:chromosome partitioning protein